jgi:hypothetical protein
MFDSHPDFVQCHVSVEAWEMASGVLVEFG